MSDETPDVYSDQFLVSNNAFGVALTFMKSPATPNPGQPPALEKQVIVRMSLEHAKVMTMMLRRHLKAFERENVEIGISHQVYNQLSLSLEDW